MLKIQPFVEGGELWSQVLNRTLNYFSNKSDHLSLNDSQDSRLENIVSTEIFDFIMADLSVNYTNLRSHIMYDPNIGVISSRLEHPTAITPLSSVDDLGLSESQTSTAATRFLVPVLNS